MKRTAVIAASALVAMATIAVGSSATEARVGQSATADLQIFNASSITYPDQQSTVSVCLGGGSPNNLGLGEVYDFEGSPGDLEITIYDGDTDSCSEPPDRSITVPLVAGEFKALVIGYDTLFEMPYDESCMAAGTGRVQVANGSAMDEPLDLYAVSQTDDDHVLLQASMVPGQSVIVPNVPADTYAIEAYTPGADPDDSPPVAIFGGFELQEGFQVQAFLVGEYAGDNLTGSFTYEEGPDVCADEEPTTTTTTAVTSTTAPAVAPGTATPATPVSGTAAYTG
jgi:hypothetical protein